MPRDYLDTNSNRNLLCPIFRRNLYKVEEAHFLSLLEVLNGIDIAGEGQDSWRWGPSRDGTFLVSSFFSTLSVAPTPSRSWSSLWKMKAPPRVLAFTFTWLAFRNKLLTMDNLRWRNMIIVNACPLCLVDEESVNHLLHRKLTNAHWSSTLKEFNFSWVLPQSLSELFHQWFYLISSSKGKTMWLLSFLACI